MRSFEKAQYLDEDEEDFPEDWYCVKVLDYIPGGCQVEVCEDVDKCPYIKDLLLNN